MLEVITHTPKAKSTDLPILFVHGMWHSAWCWSEKFMPYFSQRGYQTHAISLRGHGNSDGRNKLRWTSLADYINDLQQVIRKMERPPILVGHSMGGMIVQKYLELHEAPAAVLLASTTRKVIISSTLATARHYPLTFLKAIITMSLFPVVGNLERCRELFYSSNLPEEELKLYYSRLQDESFRAYLDAMLLSLPEPNRVKTRMLVLGAAQDQVVKPADVKKYAAAFNTKEHIFPNIAHNMMLDSNWRTVADYIINWIENDFVLD